MIKSDHKRFVNWKPPIVPIPVSQPIPLTREPCPVCLGLAKERRIRVETVQRMPEGAFAPLGKYHRMKICCDCNSAEMLLQFKIVGDFLSGRIAVGNDRQEHYRLPQFPVGLIRDGYVRDNVGTFEEQIAWLDEKNWFGLRDEEKPGT